MADGGRTWSVSRVAALLVAFILGQVSRVSCGELLTNSLRALPTVAVIIMSCACSRVRVCVAGRG